MTDLRKAAKMAFDLLCDAVEPTATQVQADIGMCAQWDVDAIECIEILRQALAQPEQEPVHFLANGVRYKVTHQGYYGCSIVGLPENLNGQWVALVEATDSKHLNCIAHQESTKPEQQPVAYLCENAVGYKYFRWKKPTSHYKPIALYTAPPSKPWVSLTDEEIESSGKTDKVMLAQFFTSIESIDAMDDPIAQTMNLVIRQQGFDFARAIEAKLKEKNT